MDYPLKRLTRRDIFPENELPDGQQYITEGRGLASEIEVGSSVFLNHYGVKSESEYKR